MARRGSRRARKRVLKGRDLREAVVERISDVGKEPTTRPPRRRVEGARADKAGMVRGIPADRRENGERERVIRRRAAAGRLRPPSLPGAPSQRGLKRQGPAPDVIDDRRQSRQPQPGSARSGRRVEVTREKLREGGPLPSSMRPRTPVARVAGMTKALQPRVAPKKTVKVPMPRPGSLEQEPKKRRKAAGQAQAKR